MSVSPVSSAWLTCAHSLDLIVPVQGSGNLFLGPRKPGLIFPCTSLHTPTWQITSVWPSWSSPPATPSHHNCWYFGRLTCMDYVHGHLWLLVSDWVQPVWNTGRSKTVRLSSEYLFLWFLPCGLAVSQDKSGLPLR